jgi:hypothetical protein
VRATRRGTRLKQATGAISGVQRCWFLPSVSGSAEAEGVNESGLVRQAVPVDDDDLPGYRLAGGAVPLFPLAWALWLAVGVQEQFSADRAGPVLADAEKSLLTDSWVPAGGHQKSWWAVR